MYKPRDHVPALDGVRRAIMFRRWTGFRSQRKHEHFCEPWGTVPGGRGDREGRTALPYFQEGARVSERAHKAEDVGECA